MVSAQEKKTYFNKLNYSQAYLAICFIIQIKKQSFMHGFVMEKLYE